MKESNCAAIAEMERKQAHCLRKEGTLCVPLQNYAHQLYYDDAGCKLFCNRRMSAELARAWQIDAIAAMQLFYICHIFAMRG
jgi:hypothetical protein